MKKMKKLVFVGLMMLGTVTVNVSGLNIRSSASTAGEKVGTAESGKSYDDSFHTQRKTNVCIQAFTGA